MKLCSTDWDLVLKITACTRGELMPILEGIEDQEVIDVREVEQDESD